MADRIRSTVMAHAWQGAGRWHVMATAVRATRPRTPPVVAADLLGGAQVDCGRGVHLNVRPLTLGRLLAAVLVAAAVLAGCTAADAPRPAPTSTTVVPPGPDDVDCSHAVDRLPEPPADLEVILGAVALPTRTVLEAHPTDEPAWLFAKHGLLVRADTAVELEIAGDAAAHARIGWGNPGPQGRKIRVPVCRNTGWLAFAGGYTVDAPMCLPLTIRAGGRMADAQIVVGRTCGSATHTR
jgi:hypothetical protein